MAIFRKVNAARHVHRYVRIELRESRFIEHFGRNAELVRLLGKSAFVFECLWRLTEHYQPALDEAKMVVGHCREFFKTGAAGETQIAQQRRSALDMAGIGGP